MRAADDHINAPGIHVEVRSTESCNGIDNEQRIAVFGQGGDTLYAIMEEPGLLRLDACAGACRRRLTVMVAPLDGRDGLDAVIISGSSKPRFAESSFPVDTLHSRTAAPAANAIEVSSTSAAVFR